MNLNHFLWTPTLFRYMEKEYVEQFFTKGHLRLSSFELFRKHQDEQRLDQLEGRTMFIHTNRDRGDQTITAWAEHGYNAYVLCASMALDLELMKKFNADSFIKINSTNDFAATIAHHIPGIVDSHESPCYYTSKKIIEADLGHLELPTIPDGETHVNLPDGKLLDTDLGRRISQRLGHLPFFLKMLEYRHQLEYRILWMTQEPVSDYIDIVVPEVIQFCSRPTELELDEG